MHLGPLKIDAQNFLSNQTAHLPIVQGSLDCQPPKAAKNELQKNIYYLLPSLFILYSSEKEAEKDLFILFSS